MTDRNVNRRTIFVGGAAAALPLLTPPRRAEAAVPQKVAQYQDHPKGAALCAKCSYFVPGKTPKAPGACKQVSGAISPEGWCIFYVAKP